MIAIPVILVIICLCCFGRWLHGTMEESRESLASTYAWCDASDRRDLACGRLSADDPLMKQLIYEWITSEFRHRRAHGWGFRPDRKRFIKKHIKYFFRHGDPTYHERRLKLLEELNSFPVESVD